MAAPTSNMPSLIDRLRVELAADKKKAAILGTLALVALVMGGRLLLKSSGPSDAGSAVGVPSPGSSSPSGTPSRPVGSALSMSVPGAPGEEDKRLTTWRSNRSEDGNTLRDLFVTDLKSYVRIEPEPIKEAPTTKPDKAIIDMMEVARAVRAQAEGLVLQSTMIGSNSSAIINGQVLRVGDYIEGFQVVAIHPRSCDVKKKGVEVSLGTEK